MASLLLNHAILDGAALRSPDELGQAATALFKILDLARARWPTAGYFVHEETWATPVDSNQTSFYDWAVRNARQPDLRDTLELLLTLCVKGPYLSDLPVDAGSPPEHIEPAPAHAEDTVVEIVERGLHHRLAHPDGRCWLVSFGPARTALPAPEYHGVRGAERASLLNLRDVDEAARTLDNDAAADVTSRAKVLAQVERRAPRVRFLEHVHKKIESVHPSIRPAALLKALTGLEAFALAKEPGDDPAEAYYHATGIRVSDESDTVKQQPNVRRLRNFRLPGATGPTFCGWHAKLGEGVRIHFAWREESRGDETQVIVYVAYVGPHLPGARG